MNTLITPPKDALPVGQIKTEPIESADEGATGYRRVSEANVSGSQESVRPTIPTLHTVVQAICLDAQHDSLKFVLRSNTGHDGE